MRHRGRPIARGGFSFIELLVVMAVATVLVAMAAPRYGASVGRYRLELATQRVVQDLNLARSLAVSGSRNQVIHFDPVNEAYELEGVADRDRAGRPHLVRLAEAPYRATLGKYDFGGDLSLSFNGYGIPDSGAMVVVRVGQERKVILVDGETGSVQVQ